ncbi:ABC transporter permease subunit [Paenibacillus sp. WQ 127069]|jgi:putative aldouronate transport system permease protein|uniref:ABC transporter permease subunit n=1 Tax=Paenibacillus baimaensis TaxID=2982185 RepID=A0ABT2UK83_9BACL|nr:ABC transporter permease subunit [Paenibacillus sp. WQ 127069]MCU6795055.1 ABC transporter permease subunit [Paenibacillus sp. WQ 127069]
MQVQLAMREMWKYRWLYLFMVPGIIYFFLFKYVPLWGVIMAFKNYQPFAGLMQSEWVGLAHFRRFFGMPEFWMLFRNTIVIGLYSLLIFFPITIVLALLLNEVRREMFKRFVQTLVYIPHFLSWVVIAGISYVLLTTEGGIINQILIAFGYKPAEFLTSEYWFRPLIVMQMIWKDAGWGTIIFLAALAGVNLQLYEAARMDGANRFQQLWHVTLPAIRSVIVILFILRLGSFLDLGFEQIFLMVNSVNRDVGEVFDTYVYRVGLQQGQFSYSAAVGLFKSVVGLVLVLMANKIAKWFGEEGIY